MRTSTISMPEGLGALDHFQHFALDVGHQRLALVRQQSLTVRLLISS
jgi:hypothetical protein